MADQNQNTQQPEQDINQLVKVRREKLAALQEADMNEYIKQISDRIRELRDILDLTADEVASGVGVSVEEYLAYENGEKEIPISLLYKVAAMVEMTV